MSTESTNKACDSYGESEDESSDPPPQKKKRTVSWKSIKSFETLAEAKEFLKEEKKWSFKDEYESKTGRILRYNCKVEKSCSAKRKIQLDPTGSTVWLHATGSNHDHKLERANKRGFDVEMKEVIDELHQKGIRKPQRIIEEVKQRNMPEPELRMLYNYLHPKKSAEKPPIISLDQLEAACNKRKRIPEELDEAFVANQEFIYGESENEEKRFGILVSTKKLLSILSSSNSIQIDATYKLNWEGFPVVVGGVSDKDRRFHPCFMAITEGETGRDFEFIFRSLVKGVGDSYKPSILIADAAEAITNGFQDGSVSPCLLLLPHESECKKNVVTWLKRKRFDSLTGLTENRTV